MFPIRDRVKRFCESLNLFQVGVSWDSHESLVAPINCEETGHEWLLRLSIGLETADDLIAVLDRALKEP